MQERSRQLTYLAVAVVLAAVVWLTAGIAFMLGGSLGAALGAPAGGATMALGAALFALGVVGLGVGYGVWAKRPWAWSAALVIFALSIVLNVMAVLIGASVVSTVLPIVLAGVVIWYVMQPNIKGELRPSA